MGVMSSDMKELEKNIDLMADAQIQSALKRGQQVAIGYGATTKLMPKYLEVNLDRASRKGFLDLKPYFARSSKVKRSKDGGWYMTVPIRRKVSSMSNAVYQQAKHIQVNDTSQGTSYISMLYGQRMPSPAVSSLNVTLTTNSGNLTRIQHGNRSNYVAFRTVSDKSVPSSWIVGRGNVNHDNMSDTMIKNIGRAIEWQLNNMK